MTTDSSRFYQLLNTLAPAPSEGFELLESQTQHVNVPAETVLMEANKISKFIYAIDSGLVRAVFITEEGKEYSKEFYWENDIVFGMRSLITNRPLPFSVITVEPCQLYQISVKAYQQLIESHHQWKDFHLRQLENHLLYKEIKEELLLLNSNEEKVALVYQTFPDLVKRVPAVLIASYLGLTPVSLSRIKKRLNLS